MNRQPFGSPPRQWQTRLTPWLVRAWRPLIRRELRKQGIEQVEIQGIEPMQAALARGAGVLLVPNHAFHYDSYVLIEASHRLGRPFHFLTAWQVFAMSRPLERWMLQRHGCFSINREGTDRAAFTKAVEVLSSGKNPLVVFPEGEIYHCNDLVTSFREGAAAIALTAARKAKREIVVVPCALKCRYVTDPTPNLERVMSRLEARLYWQPRVGSALPDRIYRYAEALLMLKEMEFLGHPQTGSVPERISHLIETILNRLEVQLQASKSNAAVPERIKGLRQKLIAGEGTANAATAQTAEMEALFFVQQLYSYPGNYVAQAPTWERMAETIDKFEEDALHLSYPSVKGTRHAVVRFGEPVSVAATKQAQGTAADWTRRLEQQVQSLLDSLPS